MDYFSIEEWQRDFEGLVANAKAKLTRFKLQRRKRLKYGRQEGARIKRLSARGGN